MPMIVMGTWPVNQDEILAARKSGKIATHHSQCTAEVFGERTRRYTESPWLERFAAVGLA